MNNINLIHLLYFNIEKILIMIEYKCKNCDRIFNRINSYRVHINKKYTCSLEKRIKYLEKRLKKKIKKINLFFLEDTLYKITIFLNM